MATAALSLPITSSACVRALCASVLASIFFFLLHSPFLGTFLLFSPIGLYVWGVCGFHGLMSSPPPLRFAL